MSRPVYGGRVSSPQFSRDVYWRRRLFVLAALIALVWGIVQIAGLLKRSEPENSGANPPGAATKSAAPSPTGPTPAGDSDEEQTPVIEPGQQVPLALKTSDVECEPENIRTVAMVPEDQQAGGPVNVELLISTLDSSACTFAPARRDLLVVIEANDKPIYDSTVCKESFLATPVVIAEGFGTLVRTTWSGRGSGKACSPVEGFVHGGKFVLKASAFGGEPDQTRFALAAAPKPTPTPTPTNTDATEPTPKPSAKPKKIPKPKPSAARGDRDEN